MFDNIDTDNSGTITYEELKSGLARLGSKLTETEVKQLMEAVSMMPLTRYDFALFQFLTCIWFDISGRCGWKWNN